MDEHGPDAPENPIPDPIEVISGESVELFPIKPFEIVAARKYLPTLADLVDRLTIVILKQINIPENRAAYDEERADIEHDIDLLVRSTPAFCESFGKLYGAIALVMLTNKTIWDNEKELRAGGENSLSQLRFSHSINGIRNRAKNVIAAAVGERKDLKVDALAADLPKEFGQWDII